MQNEDIFNTVVRNTKILKMPKRNISTFGTTNMNYYILCCIGENTRIHEGKVISYRPQIIRPSGISDLFEGFGDIEEEYGDEIFKLLGENVKLMNYKFKNMPASVSESTLSVNEVFEKINSKLEKKEDKLSAIVEADEDTWRISVMKFIVEMTLRSAKGNIAELNEKGLFPDESGIPQNVRNKIEYLFKAAEKDMKKREELGTLLKNFKLFSEYEDRFFKLFK